MQLRLDQVASVKAPLPIGLGFKLLIGPLLLASMYVGFFHATGNVAKITLFESAMGPQIGASIVAIQHGLNPPLITLLVGVGITLSFLTLPMWWYALQGIYNVKFNESVLFGILGADKEETRDRDYGIGVRPRSACGKRCTGPTVARPVRRRNAPGRGSLHTDRSA